MMLITDIVRRNRCPMMPPMLLTWGGRLALLRR